MKLLIRVTRQLLFISLTACLFGFLSAIGVYLYLSPQLPSIDRLKDVRLQVPLRVYARSGELMAEFGEERRDPVRLQQVPDLMVKAFLAAEDDRFFEHPGVDYQGILRAIIELIRTGEKRQGGSTITMQVARNFFLTREKTYLRKLTEIFLAFKIERELTKKEILELYLNKIYMGNRAYGVGAAAQVYYGTTIEELTLSQMAMIAGLPKAPSRFNPIADPQRALARRDYVLGRMHKLGFVTTDTYEAANSEPVSARLHALRPAVEAPHIAEMARAEMLKRYGKRAYTDGYRVYTTIDAKPQEAANRALRSALLDYDRRHGYRGPEGQLSLEAIPEELDEALARYHTVGELPPGLVLEAAETSAKVYLTDNGIVEIPWEGISWARQHISVNRRGPNPKKASDVLSAGDVIRVRKTPDGAWHLAQVPEVEGAFVALDPNTGAITALSGGFDFFQSKFNRATQATRQPGSGFKPFIYSAALESGYTPASLINDAPVVFDDPGLESAWRPENYSGRSHGPTRLRVALMKSRNLVSIRLLRAIGIPYAIEYVDRFGFDTTQLPRNLSLALGTGTITLADMASAYSVFANGGYRIAPYFLEGIADEGSNELFQANPMVACRTCEPPSSDRDDAAIDPPSESRWEKDDDLRPRPATRVISPQNLYLMNSMLRDVVQHGTAQRARQLGRSDLGGKTGTTNDQRDAWFNGFNQRLVAIAWVGFDDSRPLGERETGGRAALPMWMNFMETQLAGIPEEPLEQPPGMVTVRIDPSTGLLAGANQADGIFETFRVANVPTRRTKGALSLRRGKRGNGNVQDEISEQLF